MDKKISTLALRMAGIHGRKLFLLQQRFGSIYDFFSAPSKDVNLFLKSIDFSGSYISREYLFEQSYRELERWKNWHVYCVFVGEDLYPTRLSQLTNHPKLIFLRTMQLQKYRKEMQSFSTTKWVSVIGTRDSNSFSNKIAHDVSKELAINGVVVVSGLAKGIDVNAHMGAMVETENLCTVAVLGCGVLHVYPKSNEFAYRKLFECGGAVLSEYLPDEKPSKYYFPMRNRVMAAISDFVVVIQAPHKSGVRITVDFALDMGKEIFVYQPPKKTLEYELNFSLIEDGAKSFSTRTQLLDLFSFVKKNKEINESEPVGCLNSRERLFEILENGPILIQDICKKMNTSESDVSALLMRYLISGDVIEVSGNRFYRSVL